MRHQLAALALVCAIAPWGCASSIQAGDASDGGSSRSPTTLASCGGRACQPGQRCCYLDGQCFDPGDPAACGGSSVAPDQPCGSDRNCPAGNFCNATDCLGVGRCTPRNSLRCGGFYEPVCGCDGVTYRDECAIAQAGVRTAARGACGEGFRSADAGAAVIGCGSTAQCPAGQVCCPSTSRCVNAACEACCLPPRADGLIPCLENNQCANVYQRYCAGTGCGTVGFCDLTYAPPGPGCPHVLAPVCACDGQIYENPCYMRAAGLRAAPAERCQR